MLNYNFPTNIIFLHRNAMFFLQYVDNTKNYERRKSHPQPVTQRIPQLTFWYIPSFFFGIVVLVFFGNIVNYRKFENT